MKKLLSILFIAAIAVVLVPNNTNLYNKTDSETYVTNYNDSKTLTFLNINENHNLIVSKTWHEANQLYKKNKTLPSLEIAYGPNTNLPDGSSNPLIYLNRAYQLWGNFEQPKINKVYFFNFKDVSWAQEKLRNLNGSWFKPEELGCSSPMVCVSLGGSFGETGHLFLGIPVRDKYYVNNFYSNIVHEATHSVQYFQSIKKTNVNSYPLMPCWFSEGQAQFAGVIMMHDNFTQHDQFRLNLLKNSPGVLKDYSKNSIATFFSKSGTPNNNGCDPLFKSKVYDIGYFAVEALAAIGGIDSTMSLVNLISSGISFENGFNKVYGMPWSSASVILSQYMSSIYSTKDVKQNLANKTSIPTLAIIDTALDTSIPQIKGRLIGEVCILDWNSCPNGQAFMEGEGASVLPMSILSNNNFSHGTQMVSVAVNNNPEINILFVRIIGNTISGNRQMTKATLVPRVLEWLYANKDKYNIQAISMSQGHHNLLRSTNYCPINIKLDEALLKLNSADIPVMFAVGNNRDYSRIDWPACNMSPNVFAIAGSENYNVPSTYNNHDSSKTDFFDYGNQNVIRPGGTQSYASGSSVSTASFAAKWLKVKSAKSTLSMFQISEIIKNTSLEIKNSRGVSGNLINIKEAING